MKIESFLGLPTSEIKKIMNANGPKVCVFPFNGTRRWFLLEHQSESDHYLENYFTAMTTRLIELSAMLFDHGFDTLLCPLLNNRLFQARGADYERETIMGLSRLTAQQNFLDFYREYKIRVGFYGNYKSVQESADGTGLQTQFEDTRMRTAAYKRHRIFWGICADDGPEAIARLAVVFFQEHGRVPVKNELVRMYYGDDVPPVDLFISAAKPRVFDTPLLIDGTEDLYFTFVPSPYLTKKQLRLILFDHLFSRPKRGSEYKHFTAEDWAELRAFYAQNMEIITGVGSRDNQWGLWHPANPVLPASRGVFK